MKIGLISDTHGSLISWNRAWDYLQGVDVILHAGDILYHGPKNPLPEGYDPKGLSQLLNQVEKPLLIAQGNCDSRVDALLLSVPIHSPYLFTVIEGVRIIVNHGDILTKGEIQSMMERFQLHLFITGHTHVPAIEKLAKGLWVNPGSPSLSKYKGIGSIGLVEKGKVEILQLDTGDILMEEDGSW